MTVVMVVIASAATHLRRFIFEQRNNGMVSKAPAFHAIIVNDIAQSLFTHHKPS